MARSTDSTRIERINMARTLLNQYSSRGKVISELMLKYGVSRRQAYRYVQEAQESELIFPIPEQKIVFTVKLAPSLIQQVKETAKTSGYSISDFTATALARFLRDGSDHG